MMQEDLKSARLEARLPESVLDLLRRAATIQGRTLSDFVVSSAREAAEKAIAQHDVLSLSMADQQQFTKSLLDTPAPTAAMERAAKRHHNLIEPS